jgi:3-oxoacyl-[acyl-carrier-protein] synthase II
MDALRDAGIEPAQIDYINAHASSTQLNDANESMCIRRVFDAHADHLAVSGTKAYTAHPLGATGAIEAALCALALERGCIPPTLNWRDSDPACTLDVVPNHVRTRQIGYAMSNAFGFGGINSCVVMSRWIDN